VNPICLLSARFSLLLFTHFSLSPLFSHLGSSQSLFPKSQQNQKQKKPILKKKQKMVAFATEKKQDLNLLSKIASGDGHGENSSYFDGWKAYEENPFHPIDRPDGVIQMGLAENQVSFKNKNPTFFFFGLT
jgi:hypothetical protein